MPVDDVQRSAYGMLPIAPEPLWLEDDRDGAGAFRAFLDRAANVLPREDDPSGGLQLTWQREGDAGLVVATVWPSANEDGSRRFPFAFFNVLPAEQAPSAHPGFWTALRPLLEDHRRAHREARELSGAADFEERFGKGGNPAPEPLDDDRAGAVQAREASAVPLATWIEALFPEDMERFLTVLWRLQRALQASGGDLGALEDQAGLLLPLSSSQRLDVQADAWLGLLAGTQDRGANSLLATIGGVPALGLLFRPLEASDLGLVAGRDVPGMIDLTIHRQPARLDGWQHFEQSVRRHLEEAQPSLGELPALLEAAES